MKVIMWRLLVFIFMLSMAQVVYAQAIPLNKMTLQINPLHKNNDDSAIEPKTIRIIQTDKSLKVFWYSLVKEKAADAYYPTFKVKANRGIVETDALNGKAALFYPALWGNGYIRTETALPLWMDPKILELKGRQKIPFNVGIINLNKYLLKAAPDAVFEKISFFQNLYDQYVYGTEIRADVKISKSEEKDLKKFIKEFFSVEQLAKTKSALYVNNVKEDYPVLLIGNRYYEMVVINDPLNPLVIRLKFNNDKAPKLFKKQFDEFAELFEYYISHINY